MGRVHTGKSVNPLIVGGKQPLDVRTVLEKVDDLKDRSLLSSTYKGMVVYVYENSSLYVCHTESRVALTDIETCWKKVDVDYSVRIVEFESNLTDGTTILFPYQGMMAYVTSESALYILITKGANKAKDINNWRKLSITPSKPVIDKVGIDVAPEGGSGFKITGNKNVIVEDYVNVENYIKAGYAYTSKGVNSFDTDINFTFDTVILSKDDVTIELYANGDNWMTINDPNNRLGLSTPINEPIAKKSPVVFGVDIKFTDGWTISYGQISRPFADVDYELIDIYRSENSPEVYAYLKDIDIRVLTEDDLVDIDDKIDNLAHSIMIDLDGESDSSESDEDVVPLQQVIVKMNNSISKLEQTKVEPETIDHSEIYQLFS